MAISTTDAEHGPAEHLHSLESVAKERCKLGTGWLVLLVAYRHEMADLRVIQQVAEHIEHAVAVQVRQHRDPAFSGAEDVGRDGVEPRHRVTGSRPQAYNAYVTGRIKTVQRLRPVQRLEPQIV